MSIMDKANILEEIVNNLHTLGKLDKSLVSILLKSFSSISLEHNIGACFNNKFKKIITDIMASEAVKKPELSFDIDPDSWFEYEELLNEVFIEVLQEFGWDTIEI